MALLSVIIPIFNGSKYLSETIRMILASDFRNLEIIAVNDGSTDDSANIVADLQKQDGRIRLFTKTNGGVISSRNFGVQKATGDYLCFVDQDDFVKPFMYSKLISRIEEDDSEMAMCSSGRSVNGNESVFGYLKDGVYEGESIRENLLFPLLFNGYDVPIKCEGGRHYPHIWTCVFRRSFWERAELHFRAYINFEDDLLLKTEALSKARKVSTISEIGYLWRVNLKSETYAHHYVEGIGKKQDLEYQDMLSSLKSFNPSNDFILLFQQITYCKQYLDAVHYVTSPEANRDSEFIRAYYEENIYSRNFKCSIEGRQYLKRGQIKASIILPLLAKRKTITSYKAEQLLDRVLLLSLHSSLLTRIERKLKGY